MKLDRFNCDFRELLKSLISDGFTKKDISSLTFGVYRQDQLIEFLNGRDISGKPLSRVLDDLGFELHVVPIPKKDIETREYLDSLTTDVFETLRLIFVDYLEQQQSTKNKKKLIFYFIDNIIQKINNEVK